MKKIFTLTMFCSMLFLALNIQAQKYVKVPPTTDWENPSDLFTVIMGDTLDDGTRVDDNTIYQLENGGFYIISSELINKLDWPLQIEAEDLTNTAVKPAITRIPNASGGYPSLIFAEGDLTLKNIWIISGEKGPLEDHDWGKIRLYGENSRVIVEDCLIEKDRGGLLQLRANGVKIYVNNCTFRNAGNRRKISGNGRVIDARAFAIDSLIVTNSIMYNIHDRIFRSMGGTESHNYIEFDHNTIFNQFGRHGCFELANVNEVVITNNLISNPITQGTTPVFTEEQTQDDNGAHCVFTVDGVDVATDLTFSNNNIFWSQDVMDYYATNDTVSQVEVYSAEILKKFALDGVDPADTYFTEILDLNAVPVGLLDLLTGTYADPNSTSLFDIIVEDISRAGTDYDSGNLFDFATFDAGYDPGSQSAKGDTEGKSVGAVEVIYTSIAAFDSDLNNFKVYPNPSSGQVSFEYSVIKAGNVKISIFDITGKERLILVNEIQLNGRMQVRFNAKEQLTPGIYLINLQTEADRTVKQMIIQ